MVRLDEPDVLRWIYQVVFPDRLDEIECDYEYDHFDECPQPPISDSSTQGKHFDEIVSILNGIESKVILIEIYQRKILSTVCFKDFR